MGNRKEIYNKVSVHNWIFLTFIKEFLSTNAIKVMKYKLQRNIIHRKQSKGIQKLVIRTPTKNELQNSLSLYTRRRDGNMHSFKKFPGFSGIIYSFLLTARALSIMSSSLKVKLWIKKCTLISCVNLWMQSEGNASKNGKQTVGFSFVTMLWHIGQFWSRIS